MRKGIASSAMALLLCLGVGMAGCEGGPSISTIRTPESWPQFKKSAPNPEPPRDYISEWRDVAKKRNLYWNIGCSTVTNDMYGWAYFHENGWKLFREDGGEDSYVAQGKTQQDVAMALLKVIQDPPNFHPQSRVEEDARDHEKHKQCPPELHGGPQ